MHHERSHVSVKDELRSTSRLRSCLCFSHVIKNLRALTCVAKNASVEINLKAELAVLLEKRIRMSVNVNYVTWENKLK